MAVKIVELKSNKGSADYEVDVSNAKPLPEDLEDYVLGLINIYKKDEEFPIPWDAGFGIEDNNFVIEGGAGPNGFGYCRVEVPKSEANSVYDIEIFLSHESPKTRRVIDDLAKYGWIVKE